MPGTDYCGLDAAILFNGLGRRDRYLTWLTGFKAWGSFIKSTQKTEQQQTPKSHQEGLWNALPASLCRTSSSSSNSEAPCDRLKK